MRRRQGCARPRPQEGSGQIYLRTLTPAAKRSATMTSSLDPFETYRKTAARLQHPTGVSWFRRYRQSRHENLLIPRLVIATSRPRG